MNLPKIPGLDPVTSTLGGVKNSLLGSGLGKALLIAAVAIVLLLCAAVAFAAEYDAKLDRVKDGDTVAAFIEIWPNTLVSVNQRGEVVQITTATAVRLAGINTPESYPSAAAALCRETGLSDKTDSEKAKLSACVQCEVSAGLAAKERLTELTLNAQCIVIDPDPAASKYAGRVSGRLMCDGVDVGAQLIADGYATPYTGDKREPAKGCVP